jgi:hypothetical protein
MGCGVPERNSRPRRFPNTGLQKVRSTVKAARRALDAPFSSATRDCSREYDSDPLRERLKKRGTELIAPYRSNNRHRRFEDKRKLRRYRKR